MLEKENFNMWHCEESFHVSHNIFYLFYIKNSPRIKLSKVNIEKNEQLMKKGGGGFAQMQNLHWESVQFDENFIFTHIKQVVIKAINMDLHMLSVTCNYIDSV